jgi:hypothetical protein
MKVYLVLGYRKGTSRDSGWDRDSARVFRTKRNADRASKNDYDDYDDVQVDAVNLEQ